MALTVPFGGPILCPTASSYEEILTCTTPQGFWAFDVRRQKATSVAVTRACLAPVLIVPRRKDEETAESATSTTVGTNNEILSWIVPHTDGSLHLCNMDGESTTTSSASSAKKNLGTSIFKLSSRPEVLLFCDPWVAVVTADGSEVTTFALDDECRNGGGDGAGGISHLSTFIRPATSRVLGWKMVKGHTADSAMLFWIEKPHGAGKNNSSLILRSALISEQGTQQRPEIVLEGLGSNLLGGNSLLAAEQWSVHVSKNATQTLALASADGSSVAIVTLSVLDGTRVRSFAAPAAAADSSKAVDEDAASAENVQRYLSVQLGSTSSSSSSTPSLRFAFRRADGQIALSSISVSALLEDPDRLLRHAIFTSPSAVFLQQQGEGHKHYFATDAAFSHWHVLDGVKLSIVPAGKETTSSSLAGEKKKKSQSVYRDPLFGGDDEGEELEDDATSTMLDELMMLMKERKEEISSLSSQQQEAQAKKPAAKAVKGKKATGKKSSAPPTPSQQPLSQPSQQDGASSSQYSNSSIDSLSAAIHQCLLKKDWSALVDTMERSTSIRLSLVYEILAAIATNGEEEDLSFTAPVIFASVGRTWFDYAPKRAAKIGLNGSAAAVVPTFLLLKSALLQSLQYGALDCVPLLIDLIEGVVAAFSTDICRAPKAQGGGIEAIREVARLLRSVVDVSSHQPGYRLGQLTAKYGKESELKKVPQVPDNVGRRIVTEKVAASVVKPGTIRL